MNSKKVSSLKKELFRNQYEGQRVSISWRQQLLRVWFSNLLLSARISVAQTSIDLDLTRNLVRYSLHEKNYSGDIQWIRSALYLDLTRNSVRCSLHEKLLRTHRVHSVALPEAVNTWGARTGQGSTFLIPLLQNRSAFGTKLECRLRSREYDSTALEEKETDFWSASN